MIIIIDLIIILLFLILSGLSYFLGRKGQKNITLSAPKKLIEKHDKTAQLKAIKEIKNFLDYNGDEQEDIE